MAPSAASNARPRRIGIDARAAAEEQAGGGRYVRELLRALARRDDPHRFVLFAHKRWEEPLDERFSWRLREAPDVAWHLASAASASRACDVYLATNSYLTIWFTRIPSVPVIYDLVAFDPALRPQRRASVIERVTLGRALQRAAHVLTISQASADALVARYPRAAGRVTVTPLGVSPALETTEAHADVPEPFVLAVGTLEPRKNLPRLVGAFQRLPVALRERHTLVVVGRPGWHREESMTALASLGDRARVLGQVPDEVLADLYRRCAVFCFPSLGEGFGLPVLEAMAAGAPVVTSDRSSLPEVGGDAVEYVDPTRVESIAVGLELVLADPAHARALGARGRERAREFSWDRTAALTLAALEGVVEG
jgi:alpha-1,3-rhamnosyl/mannosyltransferase